MQEHAEIIDLLKRIEENQVKGLEAQEQQVAFTKEHLEKSQRAVSASVELQRVAIARAAQVRNIVLPLIVLLILLIGYLLVKWRIL